MDQRARSGLLVLMLTGCVLGGALPPGEWLVDLGRDYPRTPQAGLSDADAEITLLLMEAAARVSPDLAEAWLWQYDMLVALERIEAAQQVLARYVKLQPDDIAAHLNWVELQVEQLQTAEARAEFCESHLRQPGLPGKVASDLRRRLAEYHLGRGERDKAAVQAKVAIDAYEFNFAARQLLESIQAGPAADSAEPNPNNLANLLLALRACPNDPVLVQEVADELLRLNMLEPAERLYGHAVALLQLFDPHGELAAAITDRATALYLLDRAQEASEQIDKAGEQWRLLLARNAGELGPGLTAEMAWFYAFYRPQPDQAEKLARVAVAEAPDLLIARRALGSALRQLGRTEDAKTELAPIAERDVAAAAEYAQLLAADDPAAARTVVSQAATRPADPAGELAITRAAARLGVERISTRPAPAGAAQDVQRFPWAVLEYPLHPDKFMSLELKVPRPEMPPGQPWMLTARLANIGSFPITVGPGMMVAPDLLMSVETRGDRLRTTGPTLRFSLNRTPQLMPGESVEVAHTVDLGTIRSGMIGTPQMTHEVTVNAVLSPLALINAEGQEVVAPAVGGLLADPLKFRRAAFVPTEQGMSALMGRLRASEPVSRIEAMEVLAMLLAEHQHLQAGRLQYEARPVDAAGIQAAILGMASDPEWHVRARLAECLRWFTLDKAATSTATALLSDPHWLVRGLTLRALADHYGTSMNFRTSVLVRAAQADPEPWVRRLAVSLDARITAAATAQP